MNDFVREILPICFIINCGNCFAISENINKSNDNAYIGNDLYLKGDCINKSDAGERKPNVIFIYADDLGRGMLSHFGQKYITTPNIDYLFNRGTSFEYAYGCTYSAPARASMLTGYHDCRKDKWNISSGGLFRDLDPSCLDSLENKLNKKSINLPKGDLYLPQVFKNAGYITGQVGKLEWGFTSTRQQLREHGWDYYCGYMDHVRAHFYYPNFLFECDSILNIPLNTHPTCGRGFENESTENFKNRWNMAGKAVYSQNLFLDRILKFIREHKEKPFFLYHSTQLPHGPVAIPSVDPEIANNPDLTSIEKEYASMVKMLDNHVGLILNELRNLGILDNTIIVFASDNGHETYYTNENRCLKGPVRDMNGKSFDAWNYPFNSEATGDRFNGNDGFSGKKWMNWEGGVRVPLVFCWPGHIKEGKISNQVVANYDLLTTFADYLGVELTYEKDGESLVPIIFDGHNVLDKKRYVFVSSRDGMAVIDNEKWKLRYNNKLKAYRLHNLEKDYTEKDILNDKYPEIYKRLKFELDKVMK